MAGVVLRALTAGALWSSGIAVALDGGALAAFAEDDLSRCKGIRASAPAAPNADNAAAAQISVTESSPGAERVGETPSEWQAAKPCAEHVGKERKVHDMSPAQLAQFQLPPRSPPPSTTQGTSQGTTGGDVSPRYPYRPLVQNLKYEYAIGSESPIDYRRNSDLNRQVPDNVLVATPQVNGFIIYRPNDWLVGTLELILEKEYVVEAPSVINLPGGGQVFPKNGPNSILVDQGFVTVKRVTAPFELHAGRRNYEDNRHWLYDTSLDMGSVELRTGRFRAEATAGRQALWDLAFGTNQVKDKIETYMLYTEYLGIEDTRLAAYAIRRYDQTRQEGQKTNLGVRALGRPTDYFKYWVELGVLQGRDEQSRRFRGRGLDIGGTYTIEGLPLYPNFTLSYAYGSGDNNPNDSVNKEFRQTGMESNEEKWAGLAKFKYYGEVLDPQLSNLKIFTVGFGFRPVRSVSVDLVHHWYRLNAIADEVRGSAVTAVMNQDDSALSKDVGRELDLVIGIRNVFGIRRLGIDLRMGWFYPGKAYRIEEGDPDDPTFRPANKGIALVAKFWY